MRTILVTGGSGMVGNYLRDLIITNIQNKESVAASKDKWIFLYGRSSTLNLLTNEVSRGYDLTLYEDVQSCFETFRPDLVIHLAANVGGLYKNMRERVLMFRQNILMNQYIVDACHQYGVQKGIFCLSTCVFPADPPKGFPLSEEMLMDAPPHPSNENYAYAKRMLYQQCHNYNLEYSREYICLSPVNLYGRWDNYHLEDSHVIPGLIHKMYLHCQKDACGAFEVMGTGRAMRQFLYAGDFAKIILMMIDIDHDDDHYICAPDDEISIQDVVQKIRVIFEKRFHRKIDIQWNHQYSDGILQKTACNARLKNRIQDLQLESFETALERSIDWFIENYNEPNVRGFIK